MKKALKFTEGFCLALMILLLACFPREVSGAVSGALKLCAVRIVPALFLFFTLSSLFIARGYAASLARKAKIPAPFILGFIGGYPSGAKAVRELYESGAFKKSEAERLLLTCNNCGIGFTVSVIGSCLGSPKAGTAVLLITLYSAALTHLIFSKGVSAASVEISREPFHKALSSAVSSAVKGVLSVCGCVIFFGSILALIRDLGIFSSRGFALAAALTELGSASEALRELSFTDAFPLAAFAVSFGGMSVYLQTLTVLDGSDLNAGGYLLAKLFQGMVSYLTAFFLSPVFCAKAFQSEAVISIKGLFTIIVCIAAVVISYYFLKKRKKVWK